METALKIVQLIVSLSILVICHEFGHFIFAKIFKTRVEKFYLFFDPWFSLFKFKKGDTEYGIGWLPLGGYVKISGMIDESMDTEQMAKDPQPWEFRSKPAWQRLIIMLAGVFVNVILAMFIYAMVAFSWGTTYLPTQNLKYGISVDSVGYEIGLRDGDKIKLVNGEVVDDYNKILVSLLLNDPKTLTIQRNGVDTTLIFGDDDIKKILAAQSSLISPRFPFIVNGLAENDSPAKNAGMQIGDQIIEINNQHCDFYDQVTKMLKQNAGNSIDVKVLRGADTVALNMTLTDDGKMGVIYKGVGEILELATLKYGFFESFPVGISKGIDKTVEYCKQFKLIFNPKTEAYKSVGSFITMTKIFPSYWDWYAFWNLTALFSIMLAVVNVIPIPGLDGGHAFFTIVEIITGKKPSEKFLERAQMIGMIILLAIMAFAFGNDLFKVFF